MEIVGALVEVRNESMTISYVSKLVEKGKRMRDDTTIQGKPKWLTPGVWGIGLASFLADVGHEVPPALFASFVTVTLGAPAAILGLIEGVADGLAGLARLTGGARADDPE